MPIMTYGDNGPGASGCRDKDNSGDVMKILALGTSCVDVYPQKNIVTPGGEALNIAAQLSYRDDVEVFLMGMIGNDSYADAVLDSIENLDINSDHLYRVEGETANHIIQIDQRGDRYFEHGAWQGGVSRDLVFNGENTELLSQMGAVMTTFREPNLPRLLALRSRENFLVAVDFNDQRDFSAWEDQMDRIDIFFSSAEESMKQVFQERSKSSDTIFVLTFGEHGSVAYHRGQVFESPAIPVENVVDTTGCGDCYQAHFVAEYLKTGDIRCSMQRATLEATKVTAYVGGFCHD